MICLSFLLDDRSTFRMSSMPAAKAYSGPADQLVGSRVICLIYLHIRFTSAVRMFGSRPSDTTGSPGSGSVPDGDSSHAWNFQVSVLQRSVTKTFCRSWSCL